MGKVTPKQFHCTLNKHILPSLGFTVRDGLLEHTAWQWLLSLGWRHTRMKKGVYMDGHKRPDIVEYRNSEFLPLMASYKRHMVQWKPEDVGLVHVEPDLRLEEYQVIAIFQDKSCFHINDNKQMV
jgi:hypothetical protein